MRSVYLSLCEIQVDCYLVPPQPGQIVVVGELCLQLPELLFGKRRALLPRFAVRVDLEAGVLDVWRTEKGGVGTGILSVHSETVGWTS